MEHAHEPLVRQVLDRHPPERVLVELGELDHPEARRRRVEEADEGLLVFERGEHDEIRPVLGDHAIELVHTSEDPDLVGHLARRFLGADDPDQLVAARPSRLMSLSRVSAAVPLVPTSSNRTAGATCRRAKVSQAALTTNATGATRSMLAESDRSCGSQTQAAVETSAATRIPRPTATLGPER